MYTKPYCSDTLCAQDESCVESFSAYVYMYPKEQIIRVIKSSDLKYTSADLSQIVTMNKNIINNWELQAALQRNMAMHIEKIIGYLLWKQGKNDFIGW